MTISLPPAAERLRSSNNSQRKNRSNWSGLFVADLLAGPLDVKAGRGVNADDVAFLDEERDVDHVAGFESRRLGAAGGGVALDARSGLHDLQLDFDREVEADRFVFEEDDAGVRAFLEVLHLVFDE